MSVSLLSNFVVNLWVPRMFTPVGGGMLGMRVSGCLLSDGVLPARTAIALDQRHGSLPLASNAYCDAPSSASRQLLTTCSAGAVASTRCFVFRLSCCVCYRVKRCPVVLLACSRFQLPLYYKLNVFRSLVTPRDCSELSANKTTVL